MIGVYSVAGVFLVLLVAYFLVDVYCKRKRLFLERKKNHGRKLKVKIKINKKPLNHLKETELELPSGFQVLEDGQIVLAA